MDFLEVKMALTVKAYVFLIFFFFFIIGCSPKKTSEELLLAAQHHIKNKNHNAAIIELKNVIKLDANNGKARFLLGDIYFSKGESKSAEKEYKKSIELGYQVQYVSTKLIHTLYLLNRDKDLIYFVGNSQFNKPEHLSLAQVFKAMSHLRLGESELAAKSLDAVNDMIEETSYKSFGSAFTSASNDSYEEALNIIDEILKSNPDFTQAILLRGRVSMATGDYDTALGAFEKYYELRPENIQVRLMLANAYVMAKKYESATPHINFLLSVSPLNGLVNQLQGIISFNDRKYLLAKQHFDKAIQNGMNTSMNKLLVGTSNYFLGNYEQSHKQLSSIASELPKNSPALRLLVLAQNKLGFEVEAYETLNEISYTSAIDDDLFLASGFDLVSKKEFFKASEMLQKSLASTNNQASVIARQGILKLALGDFEGVVDLENALDKEPNLSEASSALATAYIDTKQFDKAIKLAIKMIDSKPSEVAGYNLAGYISLRQNKVVEAKNYFEQALTILPNNPMSILFQSDQAEKKGEFAKAIATLQPLVDTKPSYVKGIVKYAQLQRLHGDSERGVAVLEKAANLNKNDIRYQLFYARALIQDRKPKEVIGLLAKYETKKGLPDFYWEVLGDSYTAQLSFKKASVLFEKWVKEKPNNTKAKLKLALVYGASNRYQLALDVLSTITKLKKEYNSELSHIVSYFLVKNKNFKEALNNIQRYPSGNDNNLMTEKLKGEALIGLNRYEEAIDVLSLLYSSAAISKMKFEIAQLISYAHKQSGKVDNAIAFLEQHTRDNPKDSNSRFILANFLISKAPKQAMKHYEILSNELPENTTILNNLAWLKYKENELDQALSIIKKAFSISSNNTQVINTYVDILQAQGKMEEAKKLKESIKI
jgi:putative PEP-CTERM system TPR-repeat lipoprotein